MIAQGRRRCWERVRRRAISVMGVVPYSNAKAISEGTVPCEEVCKQREHAGALCAIVDGRHENTLLPMRSERAARHAAMNVLRQTCEIQQSV